MTKAGISSKGRAELAAILESDRRFVTTGDVVEALGVDADTAAKKLSRWSSQGWLRRARRGLYIPVPVEAADPASWSEDAMVMATEVWSPCYFTGWTSASHWALTDQIFRTTVLKTTRRVRSSSVRLLDYEYSVHHVPTGDLSFGLKALWRGESRVSIADAARTVIDVLDQPYLGGGIRHTAEILTTYLDDHDPAVLVEYGDHLRNRTLFKRLGYLTEALGLGYADLVAACRQRISTGFGRLDPDGPPRGRRLGRWGLQLNVDIAVEEPA